MTKKVNLTLKLDRGLYAWLSAYARGVSLWDGIEDTAVALIRDGIIKASSSDVFAAAMIPYLPKDIRKSVQKQPRFSKNQPRKTA